MARRSVLFSPGDRPEMLRKAPKTGADVVVFDLEDAVAPDEKAEARESVREVLADPSFDPACEVRVRINPTGIAADDDLAVLVGSDVRLDGLVLPKTAAVGDVETIDRLQAERGADLPVLALIETARGVINAPEIASSGPVDGLVFGAEDLAADTGATRTDEGTEVLYARQRVVIAAAAAGVDAIDTVFTDIDATDRLADESRFAARLGFDGKLAIHPAQVDPINQAFAPDPAEVEWARRVLDAREDADGSAVFRVDGEMIDAPLISRAERIVELAEAADSY